MSTSRPSVKAQSETVRLEETASGLPADLVRALDWLRGHLSEPIRLEHLAQVAGVRPRTLQAQAECVGCGSLAPVTNCCMPVRTAALPKLRSQRVFAS